MHKLHTLAENYNLGVCHYHELQRAVDLYNMGSDYHTALIIMCRTKGTHVIFK